LRARVADLEQQRAAAFTRPRASVEMTDSLNEKHGSRCAFHLHVEVSATTPKVWCLECGEELAPLDVLRQFATRERRFTAEIEWMQKDKAKLREEVVALKLERDRLRAIVSPRKLVEKLRAALGEACDLIEELTEDTPERPHRYAANVLRRLGAAR
jgi:regulator of replication initiation timing